MSNSKNQLKKEDRAFLYFQENSKGLLSIKFGPDKYARNTSKFKDMLMLGLGYGLSFFSGLLKDKPINEREEFYEKLSLTLSAILKEAFPDVFEHRAKQLVDEEEAIKRVEEGIEPSQETKEKIEELKKAHKENLSKNKNLLMTVDEKEREILIQLEHAHQRYNQVLDYLLALPKKLTNKNKLEYKELDFDPFELMRTLVIREIQFFTEKLDAFYHKEEESNQQG